MSPVAIPRAKQVIRSLDYAKTRTMAQEALALDTAASVRALTDRALAK
jgi:phosphoenolpyruvate-protein kinase (PTS system EI component)